MFNVIISGESNVWETDQIMRIDVTRFGEYSGGPEADAIKIDDPQSRKLLEAAPTLLLYEQGTAGVSANVVRFGFVREISRNPHFIFFQFQEEGHFSREVLNEFSGRLGLERFELSRTHWAVKEGGIPSGLKTKIIPSYDVVFSFAGEDRSYVAAVARYLRPKGVRVFYDDFEVTNLWGRDLAEHFQAVYGTSGRFCVIFISSHYVRKMWTRHERRSALARALKEQREYILPARFDNTLIEGLESTVAYIPIQDMKPSALGRHILSKLGKY